ncbi:MAG: M48 family metallopeptidase [Bacteroidales bacterium]|nr:M48 family metallopeptidase [Bacteroidales bacterium]
MTNRNRLYSLFALIVIASGTALGQLNLGRLIQGAQKTVQALTLSDNDIISYVHEYITKTDAENQVCTGNDPYAQRLARLTKGLDDVNGTPLNFKVYKKDEVNAFACADGSVRVYTGLMDVMTDNELLGVIGHEMGHVAHKDTKNAFKQALLNAALRDGIAGASSKVGTLTDSQLGELGNALASSKYSQKQENNADDFGYDFLKSHGKNPVAMMQSFQKLQQLENAQGGSANSNFMNQLFSSHPQIASRIKRMTEKATKDGYLDKAGNIVPEKDPSYKPAAKATKTSSKKSSKKSKSKK